MVTFYHTVRFKSVCQAYYLFIYTYPSMNRIISDYIYPSVYTHLSVYRCDHVSTPTYLFIYLSIYPSIHTNLPICLCVHLSTPIDLSISHLHLCVCACLSIHSLIYQAAYPCIIVLCIYVPIHYRST